jgi:hypothetical protein
MKRFFYEHFEEDGSAEETEIQPEDLLAKMVVALEDGNASVRADSLAGVGYDAYSEHYVEHGWLTALGQDKLKWLVRDKLDLPISMADLALAAVSVHIKDCDQRWSPNASAWNQCGPR